MGQKGKIKRVEIAEVALEIINRRGLKDLTITAIANEIGVVPSALYKHYKNKEEILDEVLALVREKFRKNIQKVKKEHLTSLAQLDAILARHINFIRERKALPRILFSEEIIGDSKRRKKVLAKIIKEQIENISQIISEGQKSREIRKDLDPISLAIMFLGIVQPAAILWHASEGEFDLVDYAKKAWNYFKEFLMKFD